MAFATQQVGGPRPFEGVGTPAEKEQTVEEVLVARRAIDGSEEKLGKFYLALQEGTPILELDFSIQESEDDDKKKQKELRAVPSDLAHYKALERLDLRGNDLRGFPAVVCKLTHLRELVLFKNKNCGGGVPSDIGALTQLTKLDLGYMGITELPESIGELRALTQLRLKTNKLQTLPEAIGQLVSMEKLHLGENPWMHFPDVFASFAKVTELNLDEVVNQNKYKALREKGELPDNSEAFPQLLESVSKLPNLQKLDISKNKLTDLPAILKDETLFKRHFPKVIEITAKKNEFSQDFEVPAHLKGILKF